jgi:hypothetical protein
MENRATLNVLVAVELAGAGSWSRGIDILMVLCVCESPTARKCESA